MPDTATILIAEDDPVLREVYVRRFARTRFTIRTAENGDEAVMMLKKEKPDLFICDILMPKHNGDWVLEQFPKKDRAFKVIMLTNIEDKETQEKCKKLGVDGYLVKKNMSIHSLIDMAEQLLSSKQQ